MGPAPDGDLKGFLYRLFGEVEVTELAVKGGNGSPGFLTEDSVDARQNAGRLLAQAGGSS